MDTRIISVLIAVSIFGAGYFLGWKSEHDDLVTFQAQVTQAGLIQEVAVKEKEKENDKQTIFIANAYNDAIVDLRRQLDRVQYTYRTSSSKMSKITGSSKGANEARQESAGTCEGTQFYRNALEDAQTIEFWQNWAVREDIPVGE